MNYPKKPGLYLYESRHCAYITYSVKTWFLRNLSVYMIRNCSQDRGDPKIFIIQKNYFIKMLAMTN